MEEEALFDFETEIMDQYAAQFNDDSLDFDDYSSGIEAEAYDP